MIPSINALSSYLSEDLHDYQRSLRKFLFPSFPPERTAQREVMGPRCSESSETERYENLLCEGLWGIGNGHGSCPDPFATETFCEGDIGTSGDSYYPGAHPLTVACNSLLRSIPKKYRDLTTESADAAAKQKFLRSNTLCGEWMLMTQYSPDEELYGLLREEIDHFLHPSGELLVQSIDQLFEAGRLGPGASLGATGADFYSKLFSSKLTATSLEVYYQYAERAAKVPIWGRAEFSRLMAYGLPNIVSESRVTFVPKDLTQTRSICTEPSLNMFFQLGLGTVLTDRLKSCFGIDLSRQPARNVRLARLGSRDGSIATIDLESASDSFSMSLAQDILPGWFFDLLVMYRTPATLIQGERVALNMVSTMGNGFTFPLQTMLFASVVRAVARSMDTRLGRACSRGAKWGVFGDDIICPTEMSDRVIRLLTLIGFRINREKSYTERYGRFRESCGGDFYMGHNVRGVYIKTLQTPQSRYVAINLLNEWSARWRIPLPRVVGYLQDSVRHLAVPPFAPIDSGIRIPNQLTLNRYGLWLSSNRHSFLYRYYQAWVPVLRVVDDSVLLPQGVYQPRRRMFNPDGLLMSFIGGHVQNNEIPIALKQGERPRYRMKIGRAPFWGPSIQQLDLHTAGFWGWFETIVPFNLRLTES